MQNKTTIAICGREFTIVSDDSGEYIHQLAYELNERIKKTSADYIGLPTGPATALTALQILDELTKKKIQVNIFPRKNILVLEYEKGGNHELC